MWATWSSALLAAATRDAPGPFNVGTGRRDTVLDLVERIGRLAGRDDFEPEFGPAREGEVQRTALDTAASPQRELGLARAARPRGGARADPRLGRR